MRQCGHGLHQESTKPQILACLPSLSGGLSCYYSLKHGASICSALMSLLRSLEVRAVAACQASCTEAKREAVLARNMQGFDCRSSRLRRLVLRAVGLWAAGPALSRIRSKSATDRQCWLAGCRSWKINFAQFAAPSTQEIVVAEGSSVESAPSVQASYSGFKIEEFRSQCGSTSSSSPLY